MNTSQPITLTQEEIDDLINKLDKTSSSNYNNNYGWWVDPDIYGYNSSKSRTKHDWTPVLLLEKTVYDCKHCKAHKEKTKSEYCEDE